MTQAEIKRDADKQVERVVRHLSTVYFQADDDPLSGQPVRRVLTGRRGETILIPPSEVKRLERLGALMPKGKTAQEAQEEHDALVDRYRAERGDTDALARHVARVQAQQGNDGGIVDVSIDVESMSVAELSEHIKSEQPNIDQTIALAQDDPRLAEKVLEAENLASGGQPRRKVDEKLSKLAATRSDD